MIITAPMTKGPSFRKSRGQDVAERDLLAGKKIIKDLFGEQAGQDFVTPWNRFHDGYHDLIAKTGYRTFHTLVVRI